jgi:site-specific DNA-methyltransferase (adenine-specific)
MIINNVECLDNLKYIKKINDNFIDLIYCDILFGTGRKFDNYSDKFDSIKHFCDFYRIRFIEMNRILKNSGLIYIHCDSKLNYLIRETLNDSFGLSNFRNEIIWQYNSAPRKKKDFGSRHEIIFRYSKTDDYYFNSESEYIREPYSLTAPRGYAKEKYYHPKGKILGDVWKIPMLGQNDKTERTGYSTQKPLKLLYPIIDSSCPKDGIVADFFLGSGTTIIAAKQLNRYYIGCDINPKSIEITNKRLKDLQ